MQRNGVVRGSSLLRATGLAALAAAALLLTQPRIASADKGTEWRMCLERAFVDYNNCLMESDWWLHRKVCDFAFEFDVAYCSARLVGQVRTSAEGRERG